jgi:hypothetical protein
VLIGAIWFGFGGVIAARLFSEGMANFFCLVTVRRLIGVSFRDQLLAGWRSPVSAAFMALILVIAQPHTHPNMTSATALVELAVLVPLGAVSYAWCHFALWFAVGSPDGLERSVLDILKRFDLRSRVQKIFTSPSPR